MRFLHRWVSLWAERRESKPQIFAGKSGNESAKRMRKSAHCMDENGCACRTGKSTEKENDGAEQGKTDYWQPQEKQRRFQQCREYEALYGGAAGGGKSDALLGRSAAAGAPFRTIGASFFARPIPSFPSWRTAAATSTAAPFRGRSFPLRHTPGCFPAGRKSISAPCAPQGSPQLSGAQLRLHRL